MKKFVLLPWLSTALSMTLLCHAVPTLANTAEQLRWFEVELVIFSQTPSQPVLEKFDAMVRPIKPGRSIDLLSALFKPDISKLLDDLPLCQSDTSAPMFAPPQTLLPSTLCIFEPQPKPWQQKSLFSQRHYNSSLPYPDAIPTIVTGSGEHREAPYLADSDSLQLKDVVKKIRQRADMSLLLHTAWRQAPVTERRAIASRWYAGQNFSKQFDYWGIAKTPMLSAPVIADQADINQPEQELIASSDNTQSDVIEGVAQLLQQLAVNPVLPEEASTATPIADNQTNDMILPSLPDQVWQLDGLFKLHLDHYLFVNTQFNLRQLHGDQLKSVYTQHSRRVISGEIHYLDHPYLGIVLQIRRFEPERPDESQSETESQPKAGL